MNIDKDVAPAGATHELAARTDRPPSAAHQTPSEPPVADATTKRAEILEQVIGCCESAPLPHNWGFLPRPKDVVRWRVAPSELLALLCKEFTAAELTAAHVLEPTGHVPRLSSVLAIDSKMLVLRDAQGATTDILGESGPLNCKGPAMLGPGLALRPTESKPKPIILANSVEDVQVLKALNIRATSARGLDELTRDVADQIFRPRNGQFWTYRFVLADWSVVDFSNNRLPKLQKIIRHLVTMQKLYCLNPATRIQVWRPTNETFRLIEAAAKFRDPQRLAKLIEESSTKECSTHETPWTDLLPKPNLTISAARAELQRAIEKSNLLPYSAAAKEALKKYEDVCDRQLIAKLQRAADQAADPLQTFANIEMADLMRYHLEFQEIVQRGRRVAAGEHPGPRGEVSLEFIEARLRISQTILRLGKQLLK